MSHREPITCIIEFRPDSQPDAYLVSFDENMQGASKKAKFSSLKEALGYIEATFPAVEEKDELEDETY